MRVIKKGSWTLLMALVFLLGITEKNDAAGRYQVGDYKIRGSVSFGSQV